MEPTYVYEDLDAAVGRYFNIESVTRGAGAAKDYITRYTGCLYSEDSATAYDQLSDQLKPLGATPLFRMDQNRQVVVLIAALPVHGTRVRVNILLYVLTALSLVFVGYINVAGINFSTQSVRANIGLALAYAASLLAILTAHEFGHYLVGRYHKSPLSLPFFIPLPLPPMGTMGAVINMRVPPKNRRTLLDIGIAGPLAGLVVAIPILLYGLSISTLNRLTLTPGSGLGYQMEGNSILYLLAKLAVFHQILPSPVSYGGVPPLLYWLRYFFTGQPFPLGGMDVSIHPIAWAGWVGLLVTSLNLIPAGQLDGGHMLYVLFGARGARRVLPFILVALVLLGFAWNGWWLWAALVFFLVGRVYDDPLDQITPLDGKRKILAVLALVIFILVFTPAPILLFGGT
ncbi:MAG TPA: site-2 protease family protein [Anaerolineaceae bacterium]|jgi:membrane-associated protease RseP (regulator of RpoE activity)